MMPIRFTVPSYMFAAAAFLFSSISTVHLVACIKGAKRCADITKALLMPLTLVLYWVCAFAFSRELSYLIITALLASWAGDVFLLYSGKNTFLCGMLSFAAAHIAYISFAVRKLVALPAIPAPALLIVGAIYAGLIAVLMMRLFLHLKSFTVPVFMYMLVIAAMSACFTVYALAHPSFAAYSAAAGSLSFIFSDFVLAYAEFIDTFKQSRFVVMVSYILAESLITLSALFLT